MPESSEARKEKPPFMAGAILGLRRWRTDPLLRTLTSGASGAEWDATGGTTRAVCSIWNREHHAPPGKDCSCGLYAWHAGSRRHWLTCRITPRSPRTVCGVVEAWGRIELHPMGFRAEFARPVAFVIPPSKNEKGLTRQERLTYQCRLFELAETCGAEMIDLETRSLGEWILEDDRFLGPGTIRDLIDPEGRETRRHRRPRKAN